MPDTIIVSDEEKKFFADRAEMVRKIYKDLLNREVDESGLKTYARSSMSRDEIVEVIKGSLEYLEKQRVKDFEKVVKEIGSNELLLLGSCPKTQENVDILRKRGVKAILCLDTKSASSYNHDWVDKFLCIDMEKNRYFTNEKVELALKFLYDQIEVNKVPVYIHSDDGMERAPLIGALYLTASKGMKYNKALEFIMNKSKHINPNKFYVVAKVLAHAYSLRGSLDGYKHQEAEALKSIVKITENIHLSSLIKEETLQVLQKNGFKSILDLNTEKMSYLSSSVSYGWFNHLHLPVLGENVKTLVPIILKNISRLSKNGKVIVSHADKGILFAVYGEMVSDQGGAYIIDDPSSVVKEIFAL